MKFRFLLACCLFSLHIFAQKKNNKFQYHIHRLTSAIKIDGVMDEPAWQDAEVANNFYMVLPMDTSFAKVKTEVRMAYDDKNVYILATCYKTSGQSMVESLKRDFAFQKNDNFIFFMDTYNDQTNGYSFGSNAVGAEWDGTMYEGGKVDLNWTNKWVSAVENYPDKYIFEASIPFKSIRYKKGISEWGINFSRNDLKTTEKSSWTPVPRQFPTASLAYTGTLVWDVPPPDPGPNISIIPYVLTGVTKDYAGHKNAALHLEAGGDAKIAVSSALNLDLTIHPDFSQVDADKQVTNLSRYELFYPETRQFFLENGDQFNNFGYASIRPFFSRRIGLTSTIIGGARLSGKLDQNWRIGVMDMQTNNNSETGIPAQNFTVIALQRKVFARSNIGFLFVNKESFNYPPTTSATPTDSKYNSNFGLEFNLASSDNLFTGKALVLKSFSPDKKGHDFTQAGNLQFANKYWNIGGQYEVVGANYNAAVGYVPRQGYIKINPYVGYLFFPKYGAILSHGPQLNITDYYDGSFNPTDNRSFFSYQVTFRNKSILTGLVERDYVKLLQPYDPTNYIGNFLPVGLQSTWHNAELSYFSVPQSLFTYDFTLDYGGYYDKGKKISIANDVGYRFQPFVNIQMNTTYNNLQLPQPWGQKTFWLVGPRVDVTMTNKFFLTGFFQYNEQGKNININTRLQWRYRPASDFFIVYTDNYLPRPFFVKNRGLVFKFTYWLNN